MLAYPRSSDLARNAICVFRQGEQEDEDQVRIVNLRNMSREPARIDNSLRTASRAACTVASVTGSRRCRWLTTTCTNPTLRPGAIMCSGVIRELPTPCSSSLKAS